MQLKRHWDSENLRQRYVLFSVVFGRWQHHIRLSGNGKNGAAIWRI